MSAAILESPEIKPPSAQPPRSGGSDALRFRPALPALTLLLVAAILAVWGLRQGDRPAPHADVTTLPATFGPWQLTASEKTHEQLAFTGEIAKSLDLDSYTQRVYRNAQTGREVYLLLEYRRAGRGAFNHRPEACYPAAGISLSDRKIVPIDYGGHTQSAVSYVGDFTGSESATHHALLYWFGTGARTETNFWRQQVQMALGRLHPEENGWAFARLTCETAKGDEAGALAAEQDFVRLSSPALIRAIAAR